MVNKRYGYLYADAIIRLLANLMLPDGAEKQLEDWTIFFLNQTPFNTIAPVLALETPGANGAAGADKPDILYVLNLVRTKHDKTVRRYVIARWRLRSQTDTSVCVEVLLLRPWRYALGTLLSKYSRYDTLVQPILRCDAHNYLASPAPRTRRLLQLPFARLPCPSIRRNKLHGYICCPRPYPSREARDAQL